MPVVGLRIPPRDVKIFDLWLNNGQKAVNNPKGGTVAGRDIGGVRSIVENQPASRVPFSPFSYTPAPTRMHHPFTETDNGVFEGYELGSVWTDPDFDPEESAFYDARVLEIPTPRWIVYDAFRFGIDIPEGAETTHQERAYTAPIWYTP